MAKLIYSDKAIDVDGSSSKEHINIRFQSKEDFISFFEGFDIEQLRNYQIQKSETDIINGYGQYVSGVTIRYVGNSELQVRIDVVQMSEEQIMKDTIEVLAESAMSTTDAYEVGVSYKAGDLFTYDNALYRVIQAHTSQADWIPDTTPALYVKVYQGNGESGSEIQEWVQPTGSHDAYMTGDIRSHNGKVWRSTVDNNVWEPSVYGWEEVI